MRSIAWQKKLKLKIIRKDQETALDVSPYRLSGEFLGRIPRRNLPAARCFHPLSTRKQTARHRSVLDFTTLFAINLHITECSSNNSFIKTCLVFAIRTDSEWQHHQHCYCMSSRHAELLCYLDTEIKVRSRFQST